MNQISLNFILIMLFTSLSHAQSIQLLEVGKLRRRIDIKSHVLSVHSKINLDQIIDDPLVTKKCSHIDCPVYEIPMGKESIAVSCEQIVRDTQSILGNQWILEARHQNREVQLMRVMIGSEDFLKNKIIEKIKMKFMPVSEDHKIQIFVKMRRDLPNLTKEEWNRSTITVTDTDLKFSMRALVSSDSCLRGPQANFIDFDTKFLVSAIQINQALFLGERINRENLIQKSVLIENQNQLDHLAGQPLGNFMKKYSDSLEPQKLYAWLAHNDVLLKRTVRVGQLLCREDLNTSSLVQGGDSIVLVLKSNDVSLTTKGVVVSKADVGEVVSVQVKSYGKTFRGKLTADKKVEVFL